MKQIMFPQIIISIRKHTEELSDVAMTQYGNDQICFII